MNLFVLLLVGCISGDPPAATSGDVAAKSQKAKPATKPTGPGKKAKKTGGGDHLPPTAKAAKVEPLGVAGDITGALQLQVTEVEGVVKTDAAIAFTWDGGSETVSLGTAPGTCTETEPQPLKDGVTPLWTAECAFNDVKAVVALAQGGTTLFVRRTVSDKDGKEGAPKMVKKIPFVEGARLVRADGTAPDPLPLPNKTPDAGQEAAEE